MAEPLRTSFARLCRDTRISLDLSQRELAVAVGVSHGYLAALEGGHANPSLAVVQQIGDVLGLRLEFASTPPIVVEPIRQRDLVHARCSAYVDRRFRAAGWITRREVEVVHGRWHGWIDLLAFDPRTGTLVLVEVKTILDDVGGVERQLAWYERHVPEVARGLGWRPIRTSSWLLLLASSDVESMVRANREALDIPFPDRARAMRVVLQQDAAATTQVAERGLALIDPRSRRRDWLVATRSDGRRSPAPYRDYAEATRLLAR